VCREPGLLAAGLSFTQYTSAWSGLPQQAIADAMSSVCCARAPPLDGVTAAVQQASDRVGTGQRCVPMDKQGLVVASAEASLRLRRL
jgi:hypothetical protein